MRSYLGRIFREDVNPEPEKRSDDLQLSTVEKIALFQKERVEELELKIAYVFRIGWTIFLSSITIYAILYGAGPVYLGDAYKWLCFACIMTSMIGLLILCTPGYEHYDFDIFFAKNKLLGVLGCIACNAIGLAEIALPPCLGAVLCLQGFHLLFYIEVNNCTGFNLKPSRILSHIFLNLLFAEWTGAFFIAYHVGPNIDSHLVYNIAFSVGYIGGPGLGPMWYTVAIVMGFVHVVGALLWEYYFRQAQLLHVADEKFARIARTKGIFTAMYICLGELALLNLIFAVFLPTTADVDYAWDENAPIFLCLGFAIPLLLILPNRKFVFSFLVSGFDQNKSRKKRDGAFIATLLDSMNSSYRPGDEYWVNRDQSDPEAKLLKDDDYNKFFTRGILQQVSDNRVIVEVIGEEIRIIDLKENTQLSSDELLEHATKNLRCIDWDAIAINKDIFTGSIRDEKVDRNALFQKSRPARDGEVVDFFISHSWSDDKTGLVKLAALEELSLNFQKQYRRWPSFWLDKVCIDQSQITNGLKVLPINVCACDKMLCLIGPTYCSRLWCAWELFTLFSFATHEASAIEKVHVLSLGASKYLKASANSALAPLLTYKVSQSKCFDPNEEKKLNSVIKLVGVERFESRIQHLASVVGNRTTPLLKRAPSLEIV